MAEALLHPDRLFPAEPSVRAIARKIYDAVEKLPIVSPHGHTDPQWFAGNSAFTDAASLFLIPDHYVLRMLRSRGISYDALGVPRKDGQPVATGRAAWKTLCENWSLFAGTPSELWINHSLETIFGISQPLSAATADSSFDRIGERLADPQMRPLAILDAANVEVITTTEFALDPLDHHAAIQANGLGKRIRTTYRPDDVTDPDAADFASNLLRLGEITGEDVTTWAGMTRAHGIRREHFRAHGATATDHGVPAALTADLDVREKQALLDGALKGRLSAVEAEQFRAQMLTEMAALSAEDGMVMQIHAGSLRATDPLLQAERGRNLGDDIPVRTDFVGGLSALLARFGNAKNFRLIVFTLDESTYARELAPIAGYWPALMLGPPWWFHDSPNGIRRYLDAIHETAGFTNIAGFNDDTRALLSIPARHDVWRREVSGFLARLVAEHRIGLDTAADTARWLSYDAAKSAYRLP